MSKILIVDDNSDQVLTLGKVLKARGHDIESASNGREAVAKVINHPPDVILLDLLMPEMDGPSFLEIVRSYLRLQALPVVVLTGVPDSPLADRTRAAGINAMLAKGRATTDDIEKAIAEALAKAA